MKNIQVKSKLEATVFEKETIYGFKGTVILLARSKRKHEV